MADPQYLGQVEPYLDRLTDAERAVWREHYDRGRVRVYLGRGSRWTDRAGYVWRYRLVVMLDLGRELRKDEHIHHRDRVRDNDRIANLEVVSPEYHHQLHAYAITVAEGTDTGMVELDEPVGPYRWPRRGPVMGASAGEG